MGEKGIKTPATLSDQVRTQRKVNTTVNTVTQDLAEMLIDKLNNDILYWQSKALAASKRGDQDTCNEALKRQKDDIKSLISLIKSIYP